MGRPAGSKNKRTLLRAAQVLARQNGTALNADLDSIEAMNEALTFFVNEARSVVVDEKDPETLKRKTDLYLNVVAVAAKIAPFRHPTLAAVHTSNARENVLHREGVTEREVRNALNEEIANSGRLPRRVIAYLESVGGVISKGDG